MPNILHTIETRGPGGAEILLFSMAEYLKEKKFSNYGLFIKEGWMLTKFNDAGFKTVYKPLNKGIDIPFLINFVKIIKKLRIDIIHSHEFTMSFYSSIVSLLTSVKAISTFHGMNYHCDNKRRQWMMKFIANISNIVTVSDDVKNRICTNTGIDADKIIVIENGIEFPSNTIQGNLKAELGLPKNSVLVGSVGRLHEIKGYKHLVRAAKILTEKNSNIFFVIAGDGVEKESTSRQIIESGLSSRFYLLGTRNDVPNILSSLDIFVLPSLSEGTSLALLEAMSYGLPIIATDVGNNSKLIPNEKHGFLVKPKNPEEISHCVRKIIDNNLFKSFHFENRRLIKDFYSFEKMMKKYLAIYSASPI